MSCSEDETSVASVLSQMSQLKQNCMDNEEDQGMNVAHQCDVETTTNSQQDIGCLDQKVATTSSLGISADERQNTSLKSGVGVSSAKVFPCEYCGKEFNKSYNLKTHHRVHTGERPFSCAICAHGFANLGDLKRHARTHTGERPFICEFCNKAFSDFGSHKRHVRLHTGFKPFKCEECDREFTRLDSYKNHTRLHSGQLPYKCDQCQKEFNYLTTYKRHLNIHSGQRPYSCETCGKKFTRLSYLKNHKSCHKNTTVENQEKSNCEDLPLVNEMTQQPSVEENEVIEPIVHTFQQDNVEVQSVVDGHSIVIQPASVDNDSIILGHDIIDHSSNQVNFTVHTSSNDKDNLFLKDGTAQLYIAQQIFGENQAINTSNYECIAAGEFVDETKTEHSLRQDSQSAEQEENAVYIAIDPCQNNVEDVLQELRVAVVPET